MDRIQELLARITELSDDELTELKDLVLTEFDGATAQDAEAESVELAKLEELADASVAVQGEFAKREDDKKKKKEKVDGLKQFRDSFRSPTPEAKPAPAKAEPAAKVEPVTDSAPVEAPPADPVAAEPELVTAGAQREAQVPDDRKPRREVARTTVIRAGADLPGFAMGGEISSRDELAEAFVRRITSMRGIRGGDGDKLIIASAELTRMTGDLHLRGSEPEENLRKVMSRLTPQALTAAGGLGAPEESRYDLFDMVGDTDRPVRNSLPVFTTDRGGVRFMRPPTLNDVAGVVGIWTVANDIAAATNVNIRKPSFRVLPGPEVVVNTQAITMIMTFGNLMSRAYPELVARHNELGLVAHARIAEQQLLTQIGALSTAVTGRTQRLSATREVLMQVSQATASYRNRHRMGTAPLRAIMPVWFLELLRADIVAQHPGDGFEVYDLADAKIQGWFSSRNINITWAMDGEAGQDYTSLTKASGGHSAGAGETSVTLASYPDSVLWYLFAEGTFSFMDGGTLDLGLVRDSTLNAANDYQMFVETFENVVRFGHESLRVRSFVKPTGQGAIDKDPEIHVDPTPGPQPT